MRTAISSLLMVFFSLCTYGQVIDLKGTVTHGITGAPLKDVTVQLKSGGGLLDTTDTGGIYHLTNVAVLPGKGHAIAKGSHISGNFLEFRISYPSVVNADVFTVSGIKICTIIQNVKMTPGTYNVSLADVGFTSNLYFIRYRAGGETTVHKYFALNKGQHQTAMKSGFSNTPVLSKQASTAVDTLVFSRSGFSTTQVAITAYTGVYDAVLQPLTNPVIEFDDIYCALDSIDLALGRYQGDTIPLNIVLKNIGGSNALSVSCSLSTKDSNVLIIKPIGAYNNITKQDTATNFSPYLIVVSRRIPAAHPVLFSLLIKDSWGGQWIDNGTIILNPLIVAAQVVDDDSIPDSKGNGDHIVDPGETVEFTPQLQNKSGITITGVRGILFSTVTGIMMWANDNSWNYGDFVPDAKILPEYDYVFKVDSTLKFVSDSIRFNLLARGRVNGLVRRWIVPVMVPVKTDILLIPSIAQIKSGDSRATISWNTVVGAISYNLYYSVGATVTKSGTKITGVTSPKSVIGLTNGMQYAFAVSAVNATGESGLSGVRTVIPYIAKEKYLVIEPKGNLDSIYTNKLDTLFIMSNEASNSVYTTVRDTFGNFIRFGDISAWTSFNTSIVSVSNGDPLFGEGIVNRNLTATDSITKISAVDTNVLLRDSCNVKLVQFYFTNLRIVIGSNTNPDSLVMNTKQDTSLIVQGKRSNDGQWVDVTATWQNSANLKIDPVAPTNHTWTFSPLDTGTGWIRVTMNNDNVTIPDTLPVQFTP